MKNKTYDIIIAGAGPAGSICAYHLAQKGYNVLLCEKRSRIGLPVRCGEATTSRAHLAELVDIDESFIETDIHGVILHTSGPRIQYDRENVGLMLDRAIFDQYLADRAVTAGAELCLSANVVDFSPSDSSARHVTVLHNGKSVELSAQMVIAADGAETLCGQRAGLKCRQIPRQTCSTIEFRLKGDYAFPHHLSFWTDFFGIQKGYVWVFPKVKSGTINIGCGTITPRLGEPNMKDVMTRFKEKFFPDIEILAIHGGAVPVSGNLQGCVLDRFMITGDAAHHTNPLTGGGITSSMHGGKLAAEWTHRAFVEKDFTARFLAPYESDCWEKFGKSHRHQGRIRDLILGLPRQDEKHFYEYVDFMARRDFSLLSKLVGYVGVGGIMVKNLKLVLEILNKSSATRRS